MACFASPRIKIKDLIFSFDSANPRSISSTGCQGYNGAPQLISNIISPTDTINSYNGVKLGNLSYYTVFAIDYPEGSFGGAAAGRNGITPGYNVTSGTKTYDFTRALNYAVWDKITENWISSSYFNGSRNSGHCYDSYSWTGTGGAQAQVAQFVTDYNSIKQSFPKAIHIVSGSHRDSNHSNDQYNVLRDLGAPDNVNSIIGFSSPEWILIGEPGLGAGNAYGWSFQNYSTNPDQVAHLNFGLPIYGTKDNYLEFDGTDDYITTSNTTISGSQTFSVWANTTSNSGLAGLLTQHNYASTANFGINQVTNNRLAASIGYTNGTREYSSKTTNFIITNNVPFNAVLVYNSGENKIYWYINGKLDSSYTLSATPKSTNWPICMGRWDGGYGAYYLTGRIYAATIHNRALTASEVKRNFMSKRKRYGL